MLQKLQRTILTLAIVGISSGLASTYAVAAPNAYVKICKQTTGPNPVSGSFTFTIDEVIPTGPGGTPTRTVIVPVGGCSGPIGVAVASEIRVSEQPQANTAVSSITVTGAGSLVSTNPAKTTAIVMSAPFTAVVTFVNRRKLSLIDKPINKEISKPKHSLPTDPINIDMSKPKM